MIFYSIIGIISALLIFFIIYINFNPQFGGRINRQELKKLEASPQWGNKIFTNQSETKVDISIRNLPDLIKSNYSGRKLRGPDQVLPVQAFDENTWQQLNTDFHFIWYGHSTCLMKLSGKNILIDPMFGPDASPIGPFRTYRYSKDTLSVIEHLPPLDAVFLTHDHYDHLDYKSIQKLKGKVSHYYVALGVKRHLLRWGISQEYITEFDWWDQGQIGKIEFTFTPSRHFSGRGLFDRTKSLWGGWVFITPEQRIYWSGDGGYDNHFREVGQKFGPFDWAFLECGQYYKLWTQIHMNPEEAVKAAMDVNAGISMPVHWGAFTLALHNWQEPVERFTTAAQQHGLEIATPPLGTIVHKGNIKSINHEWWK